METQERNREALIEHIAEQDRIIRRRNEQIAAQVEIIEETRRDLADCKAMHARQIENQAHNAREDQRAIEDIEAELEGFRAMHSEQMKTIARLQENPRPLTADAITDEMVERAARQYVEEEYTSWERSPALAKNNARESVRGILEAALTEPTRPEGAEELAAAIAEWDETGVVVRSLDEDDADELADHLAALGYRKTP